MKTSIEEDEFVVVLGSRPAVFAGPVELPTLVDWIDDEIIRIETVEKVVVIHRNKPQVIDITYQIAYEWAWSLRPFSPWVENALPAHDYDALRARQEMANA